MQERFMGYKTVMRIGGNKMKKLFWGTLFLAFVIEVPVPTMAGVDVNVRLLARYYGLKCVEKTPGKR